MPVVYDINDSSAIVKKVINIILVALLGIVVLGIIFGSFGIVGAGERGILLRFGAVTGNIKQEGLYFKIPFIERVVKMDIKIQKEEATAQAASKDLQNVSAKLALNYHLSGDKVGILYQNIGTDYSTRIIDQAIQESVKAVTARYTAEELITKRQEVKDSVKVLLAERLGKEYIITDEVSITSFNFSSSFEQAIEAKVTAEQNALAARNKLEQVKYEAEQRVAQAEAEARAIRLQSEAANNEKYISLKALEVQLKAVEKWNGKLPDQMIPGGTLPFLNLK